MLYFFGAYLWSWVIVPVSCILVRPFIMLDYQFIASHFLYRTLGIKHKITGEPVIKEGFILGNHRGFIDVIVDAYVTESTCVSRIMTVVAGPFIQLIAYLENRTILINRGKDNRRDVYSRCVSHICKYPCKRVLFYPEGTRNRYLTLKSRDDLKSYIKFGLLKSIYEDKKYPVQLVISNNKERAFDEKRLTANYGVDVHTKVSCPIHPKDFATDVEFFDKIVDVWFDCYVATH